MKISVITVAFNTGNALERTIQSVISQDYPLIEYIIIDGGSKDSTVDVIEKYINNISYWVSEPDEGIYNAMNKGIAVATGEWLIFMNAGDHFVNNHVINKIIPYLKEKDLQIVYGNVIRFYKSHKERTYPLRVENPDIVDFVLSGIDHQAAFIRKSLFDKYGLYDEQYKLAADSIFFMRTLGIHKEKCKYVNVDVANFIMGGSSSTQYQTYMKERKAAFDKELSPYTKYIFELAEYRKSTLLRTLLSIRLKIKESGLGGKMKKIMNWRFAL